MAPNGHVHHWIFPHVGGRKRKKWHFSGIGNRFLFWVKALKNDLWVFFRQKILLEQFQLSRSLLRRATDMQKWRFSLFSQIGSFEHFPVNRQFEATECVKTSFNYVQSTSHAKLALSLHFELSTCNILKICIVSHMAYSYPWPWTWEIRVLKLKKPENWLLGQNFLCQQQSGLGLIRVNLGWLVDPA